MLHQLDCIVSINSSLDSGTICTLNTRNLSGLSRESQSQYTLGQLRQQHQRKQSHHFQVHDSNISHETHNTRIETNFSMCSYEENTYACGHVLKRLVKHCHFARNDPAHSCFGAWTISKYNNLPTENCPDCIKSGLPRRVNAGAGSGVAVQN
jgi:hypothetical protein